MTSERYRIADDAHVYFVTYSIVEWLPVFVSQTACRIVTDSMNFCHQNKHLSSAAYYVSDGMDECDVKISAVDSA